MLLSRRQPLMFFHSSVFERQGQTFRDKDLLKCKTTVTKHLCSPMIIANAYRSSLLFCVLEGNFSIV